MIGTRSRTATGARRRTDADRVTKPSSNPVTCGKKASVERCARISDCLYTAFPRGSLTGLYRAYISGLEETLVRSEICPPGLLQELGRIPTASASGPRRYSHVHTRRSQEARQRFLYCFAQADVLSAGEYSEGSPGMGQGRQRGKGGHAADAHGHRGYRGCVIYRPDTRSKETWAGQPIPVTFAARIRDHILRLGWGRVGDGAAVLWDISGKVGGQTTRARDRKGWKQACPVRIPDEVRVPTECILASPMVCSERG